MLMKVLLKLILIVIVLNVTIVKGQTNHHYKLFDYAIDSNLRRIDVSALTADGGMIVLTGNEYRGSLSATDYGFSLIRYDLNGTKLWNTFVSGFATGSVIFLRILELPDNGFAISGNTAFNGGGFIVKTDASGTVVFVKSYGIQLYDCILDPSDNGFILTTNAGNTYSGIIKTNSSGDLVWSDARNFTVDPDHYYMARRLSSGNYWAVGTAYDNPSISNGTGLIASYSSSGTLMWSKRYTGPEWTTDFREFTELADGSVLLVGTSSQLLVPGLRTIITKIDTAGNVIWCKSSLVSSRIIDFGYEFADDYLYIGGNYDWSGVDFRPATTKIDTVGSVLWTRLHPEFDYINDVIYGTSKDFSIKGNQLCFNNTRTFCSTDTALSQSCALYDTAYTFVNVSLVTSAGNPVLANPVTNVTNLTRINYSNINFVKTDVCATSGISDNEGAGSLTISVSPNPAKDVLFIGLSDYDLNQKVNFILMNSMGKVVQAEYFNTASLHLSLQGLNSGIYFYNISTANAILKSGKIIIE